jgi:hypothetical protein
MNVCRKGDRALLKGSIIKNVQVEIGVEIGLITNVDVNHDEENIDQEDLQIQLTEKVMDLFHIDGKDKVLNNICIYNIK